MKPSRWCSALRETPGRRAVKAAEEEVVRCGFEPVEGMESENER